MTEQVVTFKNAAHKTLFGILHIPEDIRYTYGRIGINLLNPGIKYRVAPNRLNVKLARELCKRGYFVLRFDPEGIGDSEGEFPENVSIFDVWSMIQRGQQVSDVKISSRFFIDNCRLDKLFLIGNCGGAASALLAANSIPQLQGLILIDLPITISKNAQGDSFATQIEGGGAYADVALRSYIGKLKNIRSWLRLLSLKSDFMAIIAGLKHWTKKYWIGTGLFRSKKHSYDINNLNDRVINAMRSFLLKEHPVLCVFAENDPNTPIFLNRFMPVFQKQRYQNLSRLKTVVIQGANHIYTLYTWQTELLEHISRWIENEVKHL